MMLACRTTVFVSSLAFLFSACTHSASSLKDAGEPARQDCEQMNRTILEENQPNPIANGAVTLASRGVAYSATVAGYLLDYTVIAGLGVVTLGVMCPGLVFSIRGNFVCLPLEYGLKTDRMVPSMEIGPRVYDSTESMRADAQSIAISRSYRQVARCFASRGDQDNLIKAYGQMTWLSGSPIYQQVSTAERQQIDQQTSDIKHTLRDRYPSFEQEMARKNRQLVVELLKNAAVSTDWASPKDGSRWRLVKVGVPTADIARVACAHLSEVTDGGPKMVWRIPQEKELEKALAAGLLTANPSWGGHDQGISAFALSSASPVEVGQFALQSKSLKEAGNDHVQASLLCVM